MSIARAIGPVGPARPARIPLFRNTVLLSAFSCLLAAPGLTLLAEPTAAAGKQSALDEALSGLEETTDHEHGHAHHEHAETDADEGSIVGDFLKSWALFHNSYLSGWLIGVLLSLVGVIVVARGQIFIGAAVSQASTMGIALALWVSALPHEMHLEWMHSEGFLAALAVVFSIGAALLTMRGGGVGRESHEAITGWVFLLSSSFAILLVAHSPHGTEEVQRLIASSLIGASRLDVWLFAALVLLTAASLFATHQRVLLFVMDPAMAASVGMSRHRWGAMISGWLGLTVGLSIRVSGTLYTFGCLVLPAIVARNVCREVRTMFWVAPAVSLLSGVVSFVLANYYDYPPAQMAVGLLALLVAAVWVVRSALKSLGHHG